MFHPEGYGGIFRKDLIYNEAAGEGLLLAGCLENSQPATTLEREEMARLVFSLRASTDSACKAALAVPRPTLRLTLPPSHCNATTADRTVTSHCLFNTPHAVAARADRTQPQCSQKYCSRVKLGGFLQERRSLNAAGVSW